MHYLDLFMLNCSSQSLLGPFPQIDLVVPAFLPAEAADTEIPARATSEKKLRVRVSESHSFRVSESELEQ